MFPFYYLINTMEEIKIEEDFNRLVPCDIYDNENIFK